MRLSILISTYGDDYWRNLAEHRARPSAESRGNPHEVLLGHQPDGTVGSTRNALAERATGDWLCFLDADDELDEGFVREMKKAERQSQDLAVRDRLLTPAVSYFRRGRRSAPTIWPEIPFEQGDWLVIGTVIPRPLFLEVGGFVDYGDPPGSNPFEGWSLWARCVLAANAVVLKVPSAVYVAHWDPTRVRSARHRGTDTERRLRWHYEVGRDLFPERYDEDWLDRHLAAGARR